MHGGHPSVKRWRRWRVKVGGVQPQLPGPQEAVSAGASPACPGPLSSSWASAQVRADSLGFGEVARARGHVEGRPDFSAHGHPLLFFAAVSSQPVVTQEPSLTVMPGLTVTLTCSMSTGPVTTGNVPGWFLKKPGQPPQQLIYQTDKRPASVPNRFSGSILGGRAALTIAGAQPEDEAEYFCIVWYNAPASQ